MELSVMLPESVQYFYIIRNKHTKELYAGSRYTKRHYIHPNQLLNSDHPYPYYTSAKSIKADPESYEVVRTKEFPNGGAYEYETRFLKKIKARKNRAWLNMHENSTLRYNWSGGKHSEETKRKISAGNKGKIVSKETGLKISNSKKNSKKITCPHCQKIGIPSNMKRWHFDNCTVVGAIRKPLSDEQKAKMSLVLKGKPKSAETKAKMSAAALALSPEIFKQRGESLKGHKRSLETRAKLSASAKLRYAKARQSAHENKI